MQVLTRCECPECKGDGVTYNEEWQELNEIDEQYKKEHGDYMSTSQIMKWFFDRGHDQLPNEEYRCQECDGTGMIEQWMDAKEFLQKMNITG